MDKPTMELIEVVLLKDDPNADHEEEDKIWERYTGTPKSKRAFYRTYPISKICQEARIKRWKTEPEV